MDLNVAIGRLARSIVALRAATPNLARYTITGTSPVQVAGSDGPVELDTLGWYRPRVGDTAWGLRVGPRALILGPTTANEQTRPAGSGTIASINGALLTVTVSGAAQSLPFLSSYSPTVADTVQIMWMETTPGSWVGLVLGKTGTYTPPPPTQTGTTPQEVPDQPTVQVSPDLPNPLIITPTAAAVWRGSGWRTDTSTLYQGDWTGRGDNATYMFYAGAFARLKGLTVTSSDLYLHAGPGGPSGATTARCQLHGASSKTATRPAVYESFNGPTLADNAAGWAPVPAATIQLLAAGSRQGVALTATGPADYSAYLPLAPARVGGDPLQGSLRIYWTTT